MTSWDSFVEAARGYGEPDPSLWVTLVREIEPEEKPLKGCWVLVSTRRFADGQLSRRKSRASRCGKPGALFHQPWYAAAISWYLGDV